MNKRPHTKLVREGQCAAEVDVELIETGDGWSPYLSLDDVHKLDDIREALRRGDVKAGIPTRTRVHTHSGLGVIRDWSIALRAELIIVDVPNSTGETLVRAAT